MQHAEVDVAAAAISAACLQLGSALTRVLVCNLALMSMQVLRVDYPLPNTGLAYKRKGIVRGEKWWYRPGSAGVSPKGIAAPQQSAVTPPTQKSSPLAKAQVSLGSL